jgi:hypothetical protein
MLDGVHLDSAAAIPTLKRQWLARLREIDGVGVPTAPAGLRGGAILAHIQQAREAAADEATPARRPAAAAAAARAATTTPAKRKLGV